MIDHSGPSAFLVTERRSDTPAGYVPTCIDITLDKPGPAESGLERSQFISIDAAEKFAVEMLLCVAKAKAMESGDLALLSKLNDGNAGVKWTALPVPADSRAESGPVQFGDDWPGIFLRGDAALHLAKLLDDLTTAGSELNDPIGYTQLSGYSRLLSSCQK